jgi:hypothetical protein
MNKWDENVVEMNFKKESYVAFLFSLFLLLIRIYLKKKRDRHSLIQRNKGKKRREKKRHTDFHFSNVIIFEQNIPISSSQFKAYYISILFLYLPIITVDNLERF